MCEFCTKHGEGGKWYENARNYTEEVFRQVSSEEKLKTFLQEFPGVLRESLPRAMAWRRRYPKIYRFLAWPLATRYFKSAHFGQIVPLEDVERILERFTMVVRLPCICRRVTTGKELRYCLGIGMDLTHVLREAPDFRDFDRIAPAEAIALVRHLDQAGCVHSIWTFGTPYIGAICNCDRDCMAWRTQFKEQAVKVMWKAEYVATVDPDRCIGCRACLRRCFYDALAFDREVGKAVIAPQRCVGCGVCRAVCPKDAIALRDRRGLAEVAEDW